MGLLEANFSPTVFVCGEDFRFGKGAAGTAHNLSTMTKAKVEVLPLLEVKGEKISSSTVKQLLLAGKLTEMNALLSEPFFLSGSVIAGKRLGRQIGFPTANFLYPKEKLQLPYGVYETQVSVDGKTYSAITNFGDQPTVEGRQVFVETHIIGFSGDLYGRMLTVRFIKKLRDIQKFACVEDLKNQLQADVAVVQKDEIGRKQDD